MANEFLNQYVKDCLRTESKLDKLEINEEIVSKLFDMYINLGEVLDGVKKATFYNKNDKLLNEFYIRLDKINKISGALLSKTKADIAHKDSTELNSRFFHGVIGVMSESSELAEIWQEYSVNGKEIDSVNIGEELMGDMGWYTSIIADEFKLDWEQNLKNNILKLLKRYPEKFDNTLAHYRNLKEERKALETKDE